MNTSTFRTVFPRQLRYWTFHCTLNALPSFCIALVALQFWKNPQAIAAMVSAVGTFILIYAACTSLNGPLADETHVLSRSLKLGARLRAWISGFSMLVVFTPAMSITPDFWCGYFAVILANVLSKAAGASGSLFDMNGGNAEFFAVYTITMLEGIILTFILLMRSFVAVVFLQARDRKQVYAVADSL